MGPSINNLIVTFVVGNETHIIVTRNLINLVVTTLNNFFLFSRNDNIIEVKRKTCKICHFITKVLDTVKEFTSPCHTHSLYHKRDNIAE